MLRLLVVAAALAGVACNGESDAGFVRFNADEQTVTLAVGDSVSTDDLALSLLSTTSTVDVGEATVSPGGGPVGTEHAIVVNVLDDFEEQVTRVTVITSGDRGTQHHLLVQDSADPGLWQVAIQSLGAEGESREDQLTVRLWTPAAEGEEPDPEAEADTGTE